MKTHALVHNLCLVSSIACLALAYLPAGYWSILAGFLAMILFWIILRKWSTLWAASSLLFISVFLAAMGVVMNLSVPLLAVGCAFALASWDLTHFGGHRLDQENPEARGRLERQHLRSLAMASSLGLAFAFLSLYLRLQIPFLITVVLVLIAVGALTHGLQSIFRRNP